MSSKKWTKRPTKDKVEYPTLFADEAARAEAVKVVKGARCITHTQVCERLHVSVALARRLMRELVKEGAFAVVSRSSRMVIYRNTAK